MLNSLSNEATVQQISRGRKTAVLCIETEPKIMRSALWLLDADTYEIFWAKTVEEGYRLASYFEPKIMLVDASCQGEMHLEFVHQVRIWSQMRGFPKHVALMVEGDTPQFRPMPLATAVDIKAVQFQALPEWLRAVEGETAV